jgi:hypothetical protein
MISFLSFAVSSANLDNVTNDYYDLYYSDYIVPEEELAWDVAKFEILGDFNWTITPGYLVEEGDIIKFKIKVDPDDLDLTDIYSIQFTDQVWADFYLNDDLLGNISSIIQYFIDPFEENENSPSRHEPPNYKYGYLLPISIGSATGIVNFFENLYDEIEPYQYENETGLYEVKMIGDLFILNWECHESGMISMIDEPYEINRIIEISYNLAWGYLDRMKIYDFYKRGFSGNDVDWEVELILLNSRSTQRVSIEWTTGLVALVTIGTITVYLRRRK